MSDGPTPQQVAMTRSMAGEQEVAAVARFLHDKYGGIANPTQTNWNAIARDVVAFVGGEMIKLRSQLNAARDAD